MDIVALLEVLVMQPFSSEHREGLRLQSFQLGLHGQPVPVHSYLRKVHRSRMPVRSEYRRLPRMEAYETHRSSTVYKSDWCKEIVS